MSDPLKLMCVLAHPDDESLGTGGVLAKYAAEGINTYLVTATRGERGWSGDPKDNPGLEALGRLGRRDEIVEQILKFWGPMVDAGSDTAWESFHGRDSQCHGWSGAPVIALMRHVLRMDPRKPGRRKVKNVGGLAWMECEVRG